MKRIIYKNVIGTVLAEGRSCYFIRFPYGCKFINKKDVAPMWELETKQAFIPQFLKKRLNA